MTPLQIRPMTRAELGAGLDWAAGEGWNPGVHDADGFHAADPVGFLLGLHDAAPVSMISAGRSSSAESVWQHGVQAPQ